MKTSNLVGMYVDTRNGQEVFVERRGLISNNVLVGRFTVGGAVMCWNGVGDYMWDKKDRPFDHPLDLIPQTANERSSHVPRRVGDP